MEDRDRRSSTKNWLMSKVSHAGEDHRDAMFVGGSDDFVVLDRAAGLDDGFGAGVGRFVQAVAERIEGVGSHGRSFEIQAVGGGTHDRDFGRIDAAHLASADAENLIRRREHDGVRFYVTTNPPGEVERLVFLFGWFSFRHDFAGADVNLAGVPILDQHTTTHAAQIVAAALGLTHIELRASEC